MWLFTLRCAFFYRSRLQMAECIARNLHVFILDKQSSSCEVYNLQLDDVICVKCFYSETTVVEWLGLEGTLRTTTFQPLATGRATTLRFWYQTRLPRASSLPVMEHQLSWVAKELHSLLLEKGKETWVEALCFSFFPSTMSNICVEVSFVCLQ